MKYPRLSPLSRRKGLIGTFYGYEPLGKVRPGAFSDMLNLSADQYPLMSTRPDRQIYFRGQRAPAGAGVQELRIRPATPFTAAEVVNGTVALCSETDIYYYGRIVADAPLSASAARRKIIPFGRNFFVAPDGKYVLTDDAGVSNVRHAAFSQALLGADVSYTDETGEPVELYFLSDTPPASPAEGDVWTDISGKGMLQKRYVNGVWQEVCAVYVRIGHAMAAHYAVPGDKVRITVGEDPEASGTVFSTGEGSLLIETAEVFALPTTYIVALKKTMPVLDFAVEHDNRVWGCRFGKNENGDFVNEIYASALGDPTVWDRFDGISTDSYVSSLGCPGAFTGAAVIGGDLVFFKENYVIRVSGLTPQDYTVRVTPARGVRADCPDTCVTLNEKIFYLSHAGVTVYDGALPYVISPEFSTHGFSDTLAFAWNGKYYLAAAENGVRRIYVYDTATGLWHVEDDNDHVRFFLLIDSAVLMLCRPDESDTYYRFVAMNADETGPARHILGPEDDALVCRFDAAPEKTWYAETGQLMTDSGSYILRSLVFRIELAPGAVFEASLRCDTDGKYIPLCRVRNGKTGAFSLPVNTPRCHSFSLRLSGTGGCTVHSVAVISEKTGEVKSLVR